MAGALNELASASIKTMDRTKIAIATATSANNGVNIANGLANKANNLAQENFNSIQTKEATTTKKLAELELRTKLALSQIQRIELARCETTVIAKGIPPTTNQRETHYDLKKAFLQAIRMLNVQGITVQYARRLQRVRGDRLTAPPAMKVILGSLAEKLRLCDAIRVAAQSGRDIPFKIQNEIPQYALGNHKQLKKIAHEIREIDNGIKTRVTMMKGDQWPQIRMKQRGDKNYKAACKDLGEMAKQNLVKASKARAAECKPANDAILMDEDIETADPAASTSQALGPPQQLNIQ